MKFGLNKENFKFIILFFLILLSLFVIYFFFLKNDSQKFESVNIRRETYENIGDVAEYNVDFVTIISKGEVYTQNVVVNERTGHELDVTLYILRGEFLNGASVDVVIGILYDNNYRNLSNTWLYNILVARDIDIAEIDEQFLEESNLEDLFTEGLEIDYAYYSNENLNLPQQYLNVLKVTLESRNVSEITEDLLERGYTDNLLMPYVILEGSS